MNKFDTEFKECPVCNSQNISKFHRSSEGTTIFKCRNCKIQFLNPQYTSEYLTEFYSKYTIDQSEFDEILNESHLDCLKVIENYAKSRGKLFDFGSGNGHLISLAGKRGWEVTGYDVDCDSVNIVSLKTGVKMYCGDFEKLHIEKESVDVVTMLHVLEHLKNPLEYIRILKNILKSGGILFITLPNIQSRSSLLKLFLEKIRLKRKNIAAYYDTAHHLFYFTPGTLRALLTKNGFDVRIIYSGKNPNLSRSKTSDFIQEIILSKITWTSNMAMVAVKK